MRDWVIRGLSVSLKRFRLRGIWKLLVYVVLLNLAFVFLYPFLFMIVTSLKSPQDLNDITVVWVLNNLQYQNFLDAIEIMEYPWRLIRTILVTALGVLGHVLSGAFVGYGFSRFRFKGKNFLFFCLIISMVVPIQTLIIPIYMTYSKLGWINTVLPLIVPNYLGFGLQGALFIFIFRQFFLSLPKSLEEATSIDGCGAIRTFFKVALPTAGPSILVCTVLGTVWHWNDVFEPSIYLTQQSKYLLAMMLAVVENLVNSDVLQEQGLENVQYTDATIMAAAVLVVVPLLIAFAFVQKQFIQSVERSGITGE